MVRISPSILSADLGRLREEIVMIDKAGADAVHIDVMDAHFVPPLTFGPVVVKHVRKNTRLEFETHLMVERPSTLVEDFAAAGADTLIVHSEAKHDMRETIRKIREAGMRPGAAINPETPFETIAPYAHELDTILLMSVHPGWAGQKFIHSVVQKISAARAFIEREGFRCILAVDGGINMETGALCVANGANELVAGTAIFSSEDPSGAIRSFKKMR